LIELLTVVAILAILAALLFPSLAGAMGRARSTSCMTNLKQIGAGVLLFVAEEQGMMPPKSPGQYWTNAAGTVIGGYPKLSDLVGPFIQKKSTTSKTVWVCPADNRKLNLSYGLNFDSARDYTNIQVYPYSLITRPSGTLMLADRGWSSLTDPDVFWGADRPIHNQNVEFRHTRARSDQRVAPTNVKEFPEASRANSLFYDGHVTAMGYDDFTTNHWFR
jgi:prepilin-type processing-associated H-X9-DG protein